MRESLKNFRFLGEKEKEKRKKIKESLLLLLLLAFYLKKKP
jgi:hypothetical protein